jgi:prepilin-type N-terminal cleavage/methylation domain-containing protein
MRPCAFSLVELVIVMAILAVLSAIAIPRFSRGADSARDHALREDLSKMNKALELYATEHGGDPPNALKVALQLTRYSDHEGNTSATRSAEHIFGPYLRVIPPMPLGPRKGAVGIAESPGPGVGWIYNKQSQTFTANLTP